MRKYFCTFIFLFAIGCSKHQTILGNFSLRAPTMISAVGTADISAPVTLSGKLIEKCPVAGCWFYLQDQTGRIKVDTKSAGFVVLDVPLGKQVEVAGTISQDGSEKLLQAQGLRF